MNENRTVREGDLSSLETLQRRLNHVLDTMWTKIGAQHEAISGHALVPRADLGESEDVLEIALDLPGVTEKDIEVTASSDRITVQGEKKETRERKGWNYHVTERVSGSFWRSFNLPAEADGNKAKASFENGVLTITIPKKSGARKPERKVPIASKSASKAVRGSKGK
jgi:HSP20 family protein